MSETITRMTIADFAKLHGVTMTVRETDRNPNMNDGAQMDHWRCTLRCQGRRMVVTFSKGMGHHGHTAELPEVLSSLASDAGGADDMSFDDWCSEYGYDTDSRKAERTYRACERIAYSLRRTLGADAYLALLYETEQL